MGGSLAAAGRGQGCLLNSEHVAEQKTTLDSLKTSADGKQPWPTHRYSSQSWGGATRSLLPSAIPSSTKRQEHSSGKAPHAGGTSER